MKYKHFIIGICALTFSSFGIPLQASMIDSHTTNFKFNSYDTLYDQDATRDANNHHYNQQHRQTKKTSLARFDSSLGTLLGVDIWFETDWDLTSTVHSYDKRDPQKLKTASARGRSTSNQIVRLIDPNKDIQKSKEVVWASCNDRVDCNASESTSGTFNSTFDLSSFGLDDFIGNDMLDFSMTRVLTADLTNCGFKDSCWQRNELNAWGGNIGVNYTYSAAVPEPSTLVLMSLGLIGLGAGKLRKKTS